ncbi:AAA family ATPase [Flammeovirga yaeyamensis]|uniref:AAA family ATPase n=1 Tax=Flammeovirga yaeyamensis TaxID=367791 RepID=A0AAX1N054_9BACT|nr:AAA family ATPase [Flammeovirga yaeyamensis]MBB3700098.1 MoxR-like ATPase [Flammeovirga yaeyamensis]NMF37271.1 AAA domain-containing protein [Flammeovirga yaeyamensis]QWG00958.1 AAA family ATPase [Flammeovirga yaeyamensis]
MTSKVTFASDKDAADALHQKYLQLKDEIGKVVIGQEDTVHFVLTAIFSQGHALLQGVPGLAKTLLINTVAQALDLDFSRIQFTPDLMPSDILGAETMDQDRKFKFVKGPIFANIILADEINRTPPKTQSALLEAMQEYKVTIANQEFLLEKPFFVLATQNPIEQEGTYPLPEAQLDRFMFNIILDYPSYLDEVNVVKTTTNDEKQTVSKVMGAEEILYFQHLIRRVPIADNVVEYAVKLVHKTRPNTEYAEELTNKYIDWGAGPRASQYLVIAAKCHAILSGKYSPDIEDIQAVAVSVLRHRVVRNFKAEAEGISIVDIIKKLL